MNKLSAAEVAGAELLKSVLMAIPSVQARVAKLGADLNSELRHIVDLQRLPRIRVQDFEPNFHILDAIISLDKDELMQDVFVVQYCFHLMDADNGFKLSCQEQVGLRQTWSRWEADKLRLLWAYFRKQVNRTQGANEMSCFQLKTFFNARNKNKTVCSDSHSETASVPQHLGALALLPDFPALDGPLAIDELEQREDAEPDLHEETAIEELEDREDAAGFAEATEEWHPSNARMCQDHLERHLAIAPVTGLEALEGLARTLVEVPAVADHRAHGRRVLKKRPAAASESPVLKKRPAAAPAAGIGLSEPSGPVAAEKASAPVLAEKSDMVWKCLTILQSETSDAPRGDVALSVGRLINSVDQRVGTFIVQIRVKAYNSNVCMLTDKQCSSRKATLEAGEILLELWNLGATKAQLQHIKGSGGLFAKK